MRQILSYFVMVILVTLSAVSISEAQQRGGRGQGPGMRMRGGMMGNPGAFVCDILVLSDERAKQVEEAYREGRKGMREYLGGIGNIREMSPEERRDAFHKVQEAMVKDWEVKLEPILTKEELKAVKPFLGMPMGRNNVPLRALRQLDLEKEQSDTLQAHVIAYYQSLDNLSPALGQGPRRGGRPDSSDADREKMREARESLKTNIETVLRDGQEEAWEAKIEEIREEMEKQRPQRGNRGQRGQRGSGRGGGFGGRR
ncbi:hypothetical protein GF373_00260 [bacterium]|nr:hypothetical protein [bacterium]